MEKQEDNVENDANPLIDEICGPMLDTCIERLSVGGNRTGRSVFCRRCEEAWEDYWLATELEPDWRQYIILGPHRDDPDGPEERWTQIVGLEACPACEENLREKHCGGFW